MHFTFIHSVAATIALTAGAQGVAVPSAYSSSLLEERQTFAEHSMGFRGCSMAENVAQGPVLEEPLWVQICIFTNPGATFEEVKQLIANARTHAAPDAMIYITGQPIYPDNPASCFLAGADGPVLTETLAKQAAADTTVNVTYLGALELEIGESSDGCHANMAGQKLLGAQAVKFWG